MEVNVVLIDDNRINLRHLVDYLEEVKNVTFEDKVITSLFYPFRPENSCDDPTRIDLDATLKKVEDRKPGVAIIDRRLEGDDEKDLSGLALSLKIQSVFRDCQIILVSSYMGAVLGMLKNFDMICFRVDRGQAAADFAVEIRKRFTEAIKYHANALTDRHVPEAQPGTGGHRRNASSRAVYISYARACDDVGGATPSREEIVNRIEASLQTHRYDVRRDKTNLGYAGLISEFMKEIGRGGCVVAVISDKYLRSAFCMSELREVHLNQQFYERICPIVLADARISTPPLRLAYVNHWSRAYSEFKKDFANLNPDNWSAEMINQLNKYRDISQDAGKLLEFIANRNYLTLSLRGLEENDFAILRRHIDACLEGSDGFVTSIAAPRATGWSDPVAGWELHPPPPATKSPHPIHLFYSYSHKDNALRDKLEEALTMLKRQGLIAVWHDRRISAGEEWKGAIDKNLDEAPGHPAADKCFFPVLGLLLRRGDETGS